MSRFVIAVLASVAVLGGCDKFSTRSDVVAELGNDKLTAERMAGILADLPPSTPPTALAAEAIANLWLDYQLFGDAVVHGKLKTDSASIAQIVQAAIMNYKTQIWQDSLRILEAKISQAAVDSAYNSSDNRLFQHILVKPEGTTPADTQAAKKAIEDAIAKVQGGAEFGKLASEVSADNISAMDQGFLPWGPKGQYYKEFEDPAWKLAPGAMSGPVKTTFGYHVIRRPTVAEATPRIQRVLAQKTPDILRRADSVIKARLIASGAPKVASGAATAIKAAAAHPEKHHDSKKVLVEIKGGDFTVADFVVWGGNFNPQFKLQIATANDTMLDSFAEELALQHMLLRQADSAKIVMPKPVWDRLINEYLQRVAMVQRGLNLGPDLTAQSDLPEAERQKKAGEKVDTFFSQMLRQPTRYIPVLPNLADYLRIESKGRAKIHQTGIAKSVELALAKRKSDSTGAKDESVRQAPSGPPVSEGGSDTAKSGSDTTKK